MVHDFKDPLISVCPENAYYTTSLFYANSWLGLLLPTCLNACEIFGTHAYALNVVKKRAYYDLTANARLIPSSKHIWQTEVSSTYDNADTTQMREALDMAINIANFVGYTCIQRYYFWYAYTLGASGESLIWGNGDGVLTFPKKYHVYKHFTKASFGGSKRVIKYNPVKGVTYLTFENSKVVFVNILGSSVATNWAGAVICEPNTFHCTTGNDDWNNSGIGTVLPAESVCSCDF